MSLVSDNLNIIFGFLGAGDLQNSRLVCRQWKKRIDATDFPKQLVTKELSSFISPDNLKITPKTGEVRIFRLLSFEKLQLLEDADLLKITAVHIHELRFKDNPRITTAGIVHLVPKLVSPAHLKIGRGCSHIHLPTVIRALMQHNIRLKSLNLARFAQSVTNYNDAGSIEKEPSLKGTLIALNAAISQGLMASPCRLNFEYFTWSWREALLIFNTLATQSIVLNYLNLKFTKKESDLPLTLQITPSGKWKGVNNVTEELLAPNSRLSLIESHHWSQCNSVFANFVNNHISNEATCIISDQQVENQVLADCLVSKKLKHLMINLVNYPGCPINLAATELLLSKGIFKKVTIKNCGNIKFMEHMFKSLAKNPNIPTTYNFLYCEHNAMQFVELFGGGRLANRSIKLHILSGSIPDGCIFILKHSQIRFKRFKIDSKVRLPMLGFFEAGLLSNCKTVELPWGDYVNSLKHLAPLPIKKLIVRQVIPISDIAVMFADQNNFKKLTTLILGNNFFRIGAADSNAISYNTIKQLRPNLSVHFRN